MAEFTSALIVPAAGMGTRMGYEMPKPFIPLNDRPAIYYTLSAFVTMPGLRQVVIPTRADMIAGVEQVVNQISWPENLQIQVIEGGEERVDSVQIGLQKLHEHIELVVVHDAVRPLISSEVIRKTINKAAESGAAIPATPCRDTLKKVSSDIIECTVDRSSLWNAQTPQCFRRDILEHGYQMLEQSGGTVTDEAGLVEKYSEISIVQGDSYNLKLTYPEDVEVAELILKNR